MHATTRMKLKNIVLGEKPDTKATYYIIRFNQKKEGRKIVAWAGSEN